MELTSELGNVAHRLLSGILSDELLTFYLRVLQRAGDCSPEEASELLGGQDGVEALKAAGLAHVRSDGPSLPRRLVPVAPELALQGALADITRRLAADQERLLSGHRRMAEARFPGTGASDARIDRLVQIITDREEIESLSRGLISAAHRDWLTLDNQFVERPIDELTVVAPLPSFNGQVRCRSIYETRCAEDPVGLRTIELAVKEGEQARLLPRVVMKMKLADESIALLPLTMTGLTGALLVRSPVVVGALREYFEMLWERAVPFGASQPDDPLNSTQRKILNLRPRTRRRVDRPAHLSRRQHGTTAHQHDPRGTRRRDALRGRRRRGTPRLDRLTSTIGAPSCPTTTPTSFLGRASSRHWPFRQTEEPSPTRGTLAEASSCGRSRYPGERRVEWPDSRNRRCAKSRGHRTGKASSSPRTTRATSSTGSTGPA
ncbi:hypothetical protein [Actinomadura atramentaria]|uniref:hypothetical protein n=1 Tax=Actinomadura atramentaria TaxID=1990 RepID=UPI00039C15DA|nr:hypothetical protein [Actinomadura atramentaria]